MLGGLSSIIAILLSNLCLGFNISDLQSSGEKIGTLLDEEAKKGKNTGYNIAKIKVSNEVIIQLMEKGGRKEHGEEVLRLISEYTVRMNENTLDIVTLNDVKNMWRIYEEIFEYGQPPFIAHKCDLVSLKARFQWDDGTAGYFNHVRKEALKTWNYFVKQFVEFKNRLSKL